MITNQQTNLLIEQQQEYNEQQNEQIERQNATIQEDQQLLEQVENKKQIDEISGTNKFYDCIIDSKWIIFIVLALLFIGLAYPASKYQGATNMYFEAPKNSQSYQALKYVNKTFSNLTLTMPYVVFINDPNHVFKNQNNLLNSSLCDSQDHNFKDTMQTFSQQLFKNLNESKYQKQLIAQYSGYMAEDDYQLAKSMFCKDHSMIIEYVFNSSQFQSQTEDSSNINDIIQNTVKQYIPNDEYYSQLEIELLSMDYLIKQLISSIIGDVMKLDTISIACGLIILMLVLKVPQLLIISLLNLAISFVIQFGFSYFVTLATDVASFNTAIQSACVVAFTFDYSLFLFSAVKKSSAQGKNARQVIRDMLKYSGKIIITSGACLCLVCIVFMFTPIKIVQSIGETCCITMLCIVPISILNTVVWLSIAPKFFLNQVYDFWSSDYLNPKRRKDNENKPQIQFINKDKARNKVGQWYIDNFTMKLDQKIEQNKIEQIIGKYENFIIKNPYISIIAMCIAAVISLAFLGQFTKIKYSLDLKQLLPRNSETVDAIDKFGQQYGGGMLFPYYVIFENNNCQEGKDCLISQEAFDLMNNMTQYFINQSKIDFTGDQQYLQINCTQIISPFYTSCMPFEYNTVNILRKDMPTYQVILNQTSPQPNNLSVFAMGIYSGVDITEVGALEFTPWYRDVIQKYKQDFENINITITEYAYSNSMVDAVISIFDSLWYIILLDFLFVGLMLFIAFKTIMAPIRLIISIILINIFYFGIAQLIFQEGKGYDIMWPVFVANVAFSIALACDYEIFSFEGIYSSYYEVFDKDQQITKQRYKRIISTGQDNIMVVLTAGFIMIVSFTGLLCSSLDLLLEVGVCLIFDLIYDCFILIPIFVPGSSYLCGQKAVMWPGYVFRKKQLQLQKQLKQKQTDEEIDQNAQDCLDQIEQQ